MPRQQVKSTVDPGAVRPQAAPTDPFVRPFVEEPANSALADLAGALSDINPALQKFLAEEQKRLSDEAEAAGERLAAETGNEEFDELVKKGRLRAGFHPGVRRGFDRSRLRNKSYAFGQALREAYAASAISETDDPEAYQQFVAKFTQQWMANNTAGEDPRRVEDTVLPILAREQNVLAQRHVEGRAKAVEEGLIEELQQEVRTHIANKLAAGDEIDTKDLGRFISEVSSQYVQRGVSGADLNKNLVDVIALLAREEGDADVLTLLDHISTGKGILGNTRYAREKREEASNWLAGEEARLEKLAHWREARAREDIVRRYHQAMFPALLENPFGNYAEAFKAVAAVDPEAAEGLITFQQRMQADAVKVHEDPAVVSEMYSRLYNTESFADQARFIVGIANQGLINENTAAEMFRAAKRSEDNSGPMQSRAARAMLKDVERLVQGGDEIIDDAGKLFVARNATVYARERMLAWLADNREDDGSYSHREFQLELDRIYNDIATSARFGTRQAVEDTLSDIEPETDDQQASADADPSNPFTNPEFHAQ